MILDASGHLIMLKSIKYFTSKSGLTLGWRQLYSSNCLLIYLYLIIILRLLQEWITYLGEQNHETYGVNSHNKENMKEVIFSFSKAFTGELIT